MAFIDNYLLLCEENGLAETRVLRELGISHSTLVGWKEGKEPSNNTKKKIADYFGLTVQDLAYGDLSIKKEAPRAESAEGLTEDEIKLLRVYRQVPDEYKAVALSMIEAALKKK